MKKFTAIITCLAMVVVGIYWFHGRGGAPQRAAATSGPTPVDSPLILTGSSTLAPAMTQMGRLFESTRPGVHVLVAMGGSSRGIADVTAGLADIGMASRGLTPLEVGLSTFTVGYDGVCFVVHCSNTVQSLSNEQIREIFTGKIRRWSEVGGVDAPITYIHRAEGRAERTQFMEFFKIGTDDLRGGATAGDNQQAVAAVLENANAIVYMSLGIAQIHSDASNPVVKILPLDGIMATQENVRTGKYPLVRPLNLVVKGEANRLQKDLINFTLSREGQDCISADHFVPVAK